MNLIMVILRLTHVLFGVFWAGATFMLASHVTPSVKATGDAGKAFMGHLSSKGKLSEALAITGTLTLLSGLIMYGLQGWDRQLGTASGIALTIGVVIGTAAYFHGLFVQRKAILSIQGIMEKVMAAGGPPSPDQASQIDALSAKTERNGNLLAYLLAVTVVLMGVFPYL